MAKKFSIEAIFAAKDKLTASLGRIAGSLGHLGSKGAKHLSKLDAAVDRSFKGLRRFDGAIGLTGAISLGAFALQMRDVIETGAEFERVLVRTGSAFEVPVRAGTAGFAKLTDAAKRVGLTTEFSALQAAEGLNSLATAGYSAEQSIAALPKVIDFASAAGLELAQSSDIASDSLGAFGLRSADAATNARNMSRVMDSMTRAAADSTTNVAELFEGIKMGGAFAATSGASIEQFVGLLGVLANKGIKGSEAGTAIRNSFLHLAKPTQEAKDTMAALGVRMAKTKDGSIDLAGTIGRFAKATSKLTRAQKAAAIAAVFGAYTVGPFLSLMDAGEGTIRKFTKNIEGAGGVTEEMAETMRSSASAQLKRFGNIIETVKLDVFAAIAPTILRISDSVGKWVTANRELIATKAGEWAGKLSEGLGYVQAHLPEIWRWTVLAGKAFGVYAVAAIGVKTLTGAVAGYEAATKLATGVAWLYNGALDVGKAIINSNALATLRLKIAQVASRIATGAMTVAQFAYNGQINMTTLSVVRLKIAEIAARIASLASQAATWIATTAQGAYTTALALSTGGLGAFRVAALASVPAIGAQVAALTPLMATVGAATVMVLALVAAWSQFNKLSDELAGSGGVLGTVQKMFELGTFDPFEAHDAALNEKARAERTERDGRQRRGEALGPPQVISPQARAAAANVDAAAAAGGTASTVNGTITVEAKRGTKADLRQAKPPSPIALRLKPSGAFAP